MQRSLVVRSVLAGLTGLAILAMLMALCGFMAGQEMNEYYKVPRGYDNDFIGLEWIILFLFGAMGTFCLIGALAAWAVRDQASSTRDTLKASAIAGMVPIILIIVGGIAYTIAVSIGNSNIVYGIIGALMGLVFMLFMLPWIIGAILACIAISLIGGLVYTAFIGPLLKGHITMPAWKTPLVVGIAGGAIILLFHVADVVLNRGVYSFAWGQAGVIIFFAITISFGAVAVSTLKCSATGLAGSVSVSMIAGLAMGLARAIGCELGAFARNYNQAGILFSDGIPSLINGMILAAIGGLLYVALSRKATGAAEGEATGKLRYSRAVVAGLLAGCVLATISLIPAFTYLLSYFFGNSNTYVYIATATLTGGMMGFMFTVFIILAEGVLVVRFSPVKTLNDSMAVAAVAGALTGIVSAAGDVINQMAMTLIFAGAASTESFYGDLIMANLMGALGCAPRKIVILITVCVIVAVVYSTWIRGLKLNETGVTP